MGKLKTFSTSKDEEYEELNDGQVIMFCNSKGGSGKTTNACMAAYEFAALGKRTLLIDLDSQANATDIMMQTHRQAHATDIIIQKSFMDAIKTGDLEDSIYHIIENLDLLPHNDQITDWADTLPLRNKSEELWYFSELLQKIKFKYDIIVIDIPPTISIVTDVALCASDYAVFVVQTQKHSLEGAKKMFSYLEASIEKLNTDIAVIGILPVMLKTNALIDNDILKDIEKDFDENLLLPDYVKQTERIKQYGTSGITSLQQNTQDQDIHATYIRIAEELLSRMEIMNEKEKQIKGNEQKLDTFRNYKKVELSSSSSIRMSTEVIDILRYLKMSRDCKSIDDLIRSLLDRELDYLSEAELQYCIEKLHA